MKYILLYNIDELSRKTLLKSYLNDGYVILEEKDNIVLIKKDSNNIIDEDIYIKVLFSYLKKITITKKGSGKVIDITKAFKYAYSKNGFDRFDNRFEWYIRNIIIRELFIS